MNTNNNSDELYRQFFSFAQEFQSIGVSEKKWITDHSWIGSVSKKTLLLRKGDIQSGIWFNLQGLFKYFCIKQIEWSLYE